MVDHETLKRLAEPFPADVVGVKPQVVSGNKALAAFFISAEDVMNRLDEVVGSENWRDEYVPAFDRNYVVCLLYIKVGNEWIAKTGVGTPSTTLNNEGDKNKSAFSTALKGAGLRWGIGRYLKKAKGVWCDYDPQAKRFLSRPVVPGVKPSSSTAKPKPTSPELTPEAISRKHLEKIVASLSSATNAEQLNKARKNISTEVFSSLTPDDRAVAIRARDEAIARCDPQPQP